MLCSASDLATATGLAEDDPLLVLAQKRASGRFRLEAGHSVSQVTADEVRLNGTGTTILLLPGAPVTGDVTVEIPATGTVETYTDANGLEIDRQAGILYRAAGWPRGLGNIKVIFTHGYETIPEGVEDAVLEHATTLALTYAHIQQEGNGSNTVGYGAAATIGITQKWANAVASVKLRGRA